MGQSRKIKQRGGEIDPSMYNADYADGYRQWQKGPEEKEDEEDEETAIPSRLTRQDASRNLLNENLAKGGKRRTRKGKKLTKRTAKKAKKIRKNRRKTAKQAIKN